jgi:hypothetical protein
MRPKYLLTCLLISALAVFGAKNPPGFPDRSPKLDVLPGFKSPPKGYGEVSFYWWLGDTLTRERITSQLEQLKDMSITGLQINYCHTDKGGATYGLTYPSQPALFSPKWWDLFKWFVKEAKKYDMSVSLSDYTLGAAGQGWFIDEMLAENPSLNGSKLESKQFDTGNNNDFKVTLPKELVSVDAYKVLDGKLQSATGINLLSKVQHNELIWKSPAGEWKIVAVYKTTIKTSFDPMNPLSGPKVAEKFYQRFEDNCPGEAGKGLNFFFSDELQFGIRGWLYSPYFVSEFKKRKGYDIVPKVNQLFVDLGSESYKTRLDYNDVMVALSEEGFFKPLYEWHNSRGMLFGCDHGGRGRDVTEFGDYFRTQRWLSGPGNDQPYFYKDVIKNKVASSIAHMYERPRTWLEGFYGSGWGSSSAEVADGTFANFAMGHNLLSLHGLYYTTHGSMWEWAAPDNHFRQPYWQNMGDFLKCTERLSYVLSQGHHRCDIAMIYPVSPVEANLKGKEATQTAFDLANNLYLQGIDFDFMDFESLNRCKLKNKELNVSGEKFKILILPALAAVRYSTIEKALAFYRAGGIVMAVGSLPEASDRVGGNDPKLQEMIQEMFGTTYLNKNDADKTYMQQNKAGGTGLFIPKNKNVAAEIAKLIEPDFKITEGTATPYIQHRKLGNRDLYFIYNVPKGTNCFFRATGKVELWNPWDGSTKALKVAKVTKSGTYIHLPLEKTEAQLIVFSPGKAEIETATEADNKEVIALDDNWEFELKPTLDNTYGDYSLPAYNGKIGVEISKMKYATQSSTTTNWQSPSFDDKTWSTATVSYGPQFLKLGPLPTDADFAALESKILKSNKADVNQPITLGEKQYSWSPYEFSWRWGLKDDAGHQGFHGMKAKINNELISFGKIDRNKIYKPVYPLNKEPEGNVYYLWSTVSSTKNRTAKIAKGGLLPAKILINQVEIDNNAETVDLKAGNNSILLKYSDVGRGYFVLDESGISTDWKQNMPLASDWYLKPSVLSYNCYPQASENFGLYRFMLPPGARSMYIAAKAKPAVWISGVEAACELTTSQNEKLSDKNQLVWKVNIPESVVKSTIAAVKIEQLPGFFGGAAITQPITFDCGKGEINLGNLDKNESLRTYSGGMWYRKTLTLSTQQSSSKNITLNLGDVVASANVYVNGQLIGQKTTAPWTFDLTAKLKTGENRIEILVYNTLGNHYLKTLSQYVGRTKSGLIGPVSIQIVK